MFVKALNLIGKYLIALPFIASVILLLYVMAPVLFLFHAMVLLEGPCEIKRFFHEYYVEFPVAVWKWVVTDDVC